MDDTGFLARVAYMDNRETNPAGTSLLCVFFN